MLEFISKFSESPPKVDAAFLQSKGGDIFKRWVANLMKAFYAGK